jgi:hypothetical protein
MRMRMRMRVRVRVRVRMRVRVRVRVRMRECTGTTVNQTSVISFKRGAFVAGTPVQPVACRIAWTNTTGVDPAWVNDGPSQLSVLIRLMATWRNHVRTRRTYARTQTCRHP